MFMAVVSLTKPSISHSKTNAKCLIKEDAKVLVIKICVNQI